MSLFTLARCCCAPPAPPPESCCCTAAGGVTLAGRIFQSDQKWYYNIGDCRKLDNSNPNSYFTLTKNPLPGTGFCRKHEAFFSTITCCATTGYVIIFDMALAFYCPQTGLTCNDYRLTYSMRYNRYPDNFTCTPPTTIAPTSCYCGPAGARASYWVFQIPAPTSIGICTCLGQITQPFTIRITDEV